jgi:hypothetical protein
VGGLTDGISTWKVRSASYKESMLWVAAGLGDEIILVMAGVLKLQEEIRKIKKKVEKTRWMRLVMGIDVRLFILCNFQATSTE